MREQKDEDECGLTLRKNASSSLCSLRTNHVKETHALRRITSTDSAATSRRINVNLTFGDRGAPALVLLADDDAGADHHEVGIAGELDEISAAIDFGFSLDSGAENVAVVGRLESVARDGLTMRYLGGPKTALQAFSLELPPESVALRAAEARLGPDRAAQDVDDEQIRVHLTQVATFRHCARRICMLVTLCHQSYH